MAYPQEALTPTPKTYREHARTTITTRQKRNTNTVIRLMPCMKRRLILGSAGLKRVSGLR